jgi:hypothetical protein
MLISRKAGIYTVLICFSLKYDGGIFGWYDLLVHSEPQLHPAFLRTYKQTNMTEDLSASKYENVFVSFLNILFSISES